jgi:hypothetical protein
MPQKPPHEASQIETVSENKQEVLEPPPPIPPLPQPPKWWEVLLGASELSVEMSATGSRGRLKTSGLVLLALGVLVAVCLFRWP